ncbi:leucine rich repeat protein [Colletotrichum cereale]|nr:leucine rich repeat protein [Colletotrichum cereale]
MAHAPSISTNQANSNDATRVDMDDFCRQAFNLLDAQMPDFNHSKAYTPDEILALPMYIIRLPDELHGLPRRKSRRSHLARAIATLLYPATCDDAVSPVIRYEAARVRLRAWVALQRKYDVFAATKRNGHSFRGLTGGAAPGVHAPVWASRILAQGPWDPAKAPVALTGARAIPMPVAVADAADLAPLFDHLEQRGTHALDEGSAGAALEGGRGELHYGIKGAEFRKGVVYEDGRMDLCRMVVGPDHISNLMDSLRPNPFVRHFLLGNNIIGPVGAREIARFVRELPGRMDTWYLAGNCIDAPGFKTLVDALIESDAVTNIWLKRNPLGPAAAADVYRLITETKNIRTLDLDQTELGDTGTAELFRRLATFSVAVPGRKQLPLRNIYLNGNGISTKAAVAIAEFLGSPACGITSLYLDIFQAITTHPGMRHLDVGQAHATVDLGQAWNYIDQEAVPSICELVSTTQTLQYLNLGHCPISPPELRKIDAAVLESALLSYNATLILADPDARMPAFHPSADHTMPDLHSWSALTKDEKALEKAVNRHLERNVKAAYGVDMTYAKFLEEEKRWIVNDKTDVRKIDSVYRNRDAGNARRRLQALVKDWDKNDDTLARVMNSQGPFCTVRRH